MALQQRAKNQVIMTLFAALMLADMGLGADSGDEERFKDVEIRVIRPRFFPKARRFEIGASVAGVMNETFIYTYLVSGILTYHFTEYVGLELGGAIGLNIDKEDKRTLFDEFVIQTKIFRTAYAIGAALELTPLYGKWQTASGKVIYFDTFVAAGAGMTGIKWQYTDFCTAPQNGGNPIPGDLVKPYPTFMVGLGQRYFMTKDIAYKWDLRSNGIMFNRADGECDPALSTESGSAAHYNITVQLGASKYF